MNNSNIRNMTIHADFNQVPFAESFADVQGPHEHHKLNHAVEFCFTVALNDYTGDTTQVSIGLDYVDDNNGVFYFDTAMSVDNGDWATMREQYEMLGACIDNFESNNLVARFGVIVA